MRALPRALRPFAVVLVAATSSLAADCPNLGGTADAPIQLRHLVTKYLGAGADEFVIKGAFTTATPIAPSTSDTTYVTINPLTDTSVWSSGPIAAGLSQWAASEPAHGLFRYDDSTATVVPGLRRIRLREAPPGGGKYRFSVRGEKATLGGSGGSFLSLEFSTPLCLVGNSCVCRWRGTTYRCYCPPGG